MKRRTNGNTLEPISVVFAESRVVSMLRALDALLEVAASATVQELDALLTDLRPARPLDAETGAHRAVGILFALDRLLEAAQAATLADLSAGMDALQGWVTDEIDRRGAVVPPQRAAR